MAKRLFDFTAALSGLVLLSPVLLLLAVAVKLDSPGPVLFRQERVGRGGKSFRILKYRSMSVERSKQGRQITVGKDPRITRVGSLLRKWKLDELPQLINVLRGDMSLVGPRPEVPRYVALYSPEQRRVLEVRPGLTDPASLEFRDENDLLVGRPDPERFYIEQIMPRKLELNRDYLERQSLLYDLWLIFRTVLRVVRPQAVARVEGERTREGVES